MIRTDLHTHTTFCDGKNTPREMVEAALAKGMACLGFSGHSHTPFDESWCMSPAGTEAYRREIKALQEEFAGRLRILCGVEQDLYSDMPTEGYDFVIGAVHYLHLGEEYIPVDETPEILCAAAEKYFGGDLLALAEAYYDTEARVAEETGCDIIAHFDLISKFNAGGALFDEKAPHYVQAWQGALDRLLPSGKPFEINTGAIARGLKEVPYPAKPMLDYIRAHGGSVLLSSDAHSAENLCFQFERWESLLW